MPVQLRMQKNTSLMFTSSPAPLSRCAFVPLHSTTHFTPPRWTKMASDVEHWRDCDVEVEWEPIERAHEVKTGIARCHQRATRQDRWCGTLVVLAWPTLNVEPCVIGAHSQVLVRHATTSWRIGHAQGVGASYGVIWWVWFGGSEEGGL